MNGKGSRVFLPLAALAVYYLVIAYAVPDRVPDVRALAPSAKAVVFGAPKS